ncbi:MAG: UDP-glucose 4-epimerase [Alphaproteobacteria bacterium]|jgi:UDP-glucose 4-epimerase
MASYLVTGGCGFIGSHLVDALLAQGHEVTVIDDLSTGKIENIPSRVRFIQHDIRHVSELKSLLENMDGCFHLAAVVSVEKSVKDWYNTHQVNQSATVALFEAIGSLYKAIPVVYASSAAVYGDNVNLPLKETEVALPLTPYGVDKYGCDYMEKQLQIYTIFQMQVYVFLMFMAQGKTLFHLMLGWFLSLINLFQKV